ncbi:IS66 family insertion sequence element accessory protein TnpB [Pseudomonas veronii]|uniref:IS66 family insertion sequence element accessory protein TnpB n=1 Tax=Pseudomonas veronii TaxID=76761 RepID=UPI0036F2854F
MSRLITFLLRRGRDFFVTLNRRTNRMKVMVPDFVGILLVARRFSQGEFYWHRSR